VHPFHHAKTHPSKPAYVMATTGQSIDYATLEARSNQLAHYWRSVGLAAGSVVAVVMENHEWFLPLAWSAQRAGLYFACLSYRLSGADLAYILNDSGARFVVGSSKTLDLLVSAQGHGGAPDILLVDGCHPDARDLLAEVVDLPSVPIADESAGSDMLYTSGTTGRPKGVKRPFVAGQPIDLVQPNMALARSRYAMDENTVYLSPAPLYHAGPLRWAMLVQRMGGTVVIMERFDAAHALDLIARYRVTAAQWVPTHFSRMLQLPEDIRAKADISSLRAAFHAAAPCPAPMKQAMIDWWGPIIHEYYGGTENNGLTMINTQEWLDHPGSVGKAMIGTVRICDENDEILPQRSEGAVFFDGGAPFAYHNDAAKTAAAHNRHGWSTLGDIGWLDEDGFLYLTDRKSNMIISGGVNIYPQEIENALAVHPKVADVAVVGAPDPDMGEKVVAIIQPRAWEDAGPALAQELQAYARERLGAVKTPRQIDFVMELQREPTGKLFKRLLRDQYWASGG
jgi:long-chain acyl-CoA synthetase